MNNQDLSKFGEVLISNVRDEAIREWDGIVSGSSKNRDDIEAHNKLKESFNQDQLETMRNMVTQIVDTTLHYLLWTIEQENSIVMSILHEDGSLKNILELSDGLCGELYTEDGWIMKYSKNRYIAP